MNELPRLRGNLRFIEQLQEGVAVHVVKDPVRLKYFRFGAKEVGLMRLIDGTRSLSQIADAARAQLGIAAGTDAVDRFVRRLKEMGLVERTQEERSALLMEFVRRSRKARMRGDGGTVLRMRFSLGDPDRLLGRMNDSFGFFFTPTFIAVSVALFAVYALIVGSHWAAFADGVGALYTPERYTLSFVILLYLTAVVIFLVHEFGHGLTCKHFGGEVHELGVMLIYFMPAFYCNVNDAWTFEKRSHRLWVTFAGGWIQLVVASLAAIVWITTQSGTMLHDVAFIALLIGGGMTILINFNPLIPLDGYYALVDWLGIPNLRARAGEYAAARLKRSLLRASNALPDVTPREARIFLVYAVLSRIYALFILSLFAFGIARFMGNKWGAWGLVVFAFLFWRMTRRLRPRLARAFASMQLGARLRAVTQRARAKHLIAVTSVLILPFVVPWTIKVSGPAVVESPGRAVARAPEAARVERVLVREGDLVAAGAPLITLSNPELELAWTRTVAAVAALEREHHAASARNDHESMRATELELAARSAMLQRLRVRRDALTLRANFDGRVTTAHTDALQGASVKAGDNLIELHRSGPLQARVLLTERDAADLNQGDVVRIKFPVQPSWTWQSRVAHIASATRDGRLELVVPLAQSDTAGPLKAGMTGISKVAVRRTHLSGAALRTIRRMIRTDLWL